jgi:hypothetical protein
MALTFESAEGQKYITVSENTSNALLYVVPEGRNFKGHLTISAGAAVYVNGDSFSNTGTGAGLEQIQLTLAPGAVVKCGAGGACLLTGIES